MIHAQTFRIGYVIRISGALRIISTHPLAHPPLSDQIARSRLLE